VHRDNSLEDTRFVVVGGTFGDPYVAAVCSVRRLAGNKEATLQRHMWRVTRKPRLLWRLRRRICDMKKKMEGSSCCGCWLVRDNEQVYATFSR